MIMVHTAKYSNVHADLATMTIAGARQVLAIATPGLVNLRKQTPLPTRKLNPRSCCLQLQAECQA